jgi:hypothetical protein
MLLKEFDEPNNPNFQLESLSSSDAMVLTELSEDTGPILPKSLLLVTPASGKEQSDWKTCTSAWCFNS